MRKYIEVEYQGDIMRGFHDVANEEKVVIVTHGIGGNKLGHKFVFKQFADRCVENGISTLRFDFVGTGESDGDFANTRHSDQVLQLLEIIKKAKELGYKEIYLCSTTIGCYSVWHAANNYEGISAIINWNPICNYDRYEANHKKRAQEDGTIYMKGIYTKPSYVRDLENLDRKVPSFNIPLLMLQGTLDSEFEFDDARDTCEELGYVYEQIENGNHLWEGIDVRNQLFGATIDFINNN